MDEQLLKDFLETAKVNNWDWDVVMPKFPELEGVDLQLLKDYAASAKANNYDYSIVNSKFPELFPKKKDDSEPTSTDQPVVSDTEPISSDISVQEPEATTYFPINTDTGEVDTAIERWFGKNEVTDFFGDIYRAGAQGQKQAGVVDDALSLMTSGSDATDEEVQDFLNAVNEMNNSPMSDEMKDFERVFEEQGGGVWGFIKGIVESPTIIPQLFVSSVSAMANPASAGAAVVGGAAGSAVPIVGTVAGAIGAAGATLETSLSFAEFLQEEVRERGLDFTKENVKEVLNDPDALSRIRRRAAARGISIGAIDGLTGGVAGKVTGSIAKAGAKTVGRRLASASTGIGVEGVGGSLGEVAGRLAAGQEMDIKEIGFEGIAGTATAPLTVGTAVYKAPKYKIKGKVVPADVAIDFVRNATPQEILESEIDIKNNNELSQEFKNRRSDAQIEINFDPRYSAEDRSKLIALQKEKENLNPDVYVGKKRIKKIESEMDAIMDKYEETTVDVTSQEAVDALKQEGIENPTQQQIIDKTDQLIKEKQDAVQEQETRDIPDAEPTEAVQEVEAEVREPAVEEEKTQLTPEEEAAAIEKDIVDNNLESFANRVVEGGIENFSPEALDFYAENKEVLDQLIQEKQRQVPKTQSKERSLAMRIADGQTEFNDAEIDLFAANEEAIIAEVDAIANTRGIEITSDTYKNILESTKSTTAKDVTTEKVNKLRKEFWQNWNKAWREAKADSKGKQKLLFDAIAQNVKDGAITKRQQKALMNKAKNINLDNEAKVQELIDYSEKIFTDAEYADKVAKARKIRNRIKKAAKNAEANLSRAAKDFSSVDPTKAESIDDYLNAAQNLIEGLSPTKAALTRKGGITVRGAADIDAVNQYSSKELKIAEERKNQRLAQQFEELTGKNADEFSLSEMREMIYNETNEDIQAKVEEKKQAIKEAADNAFNQVRETIEQTLNDSSIPDKTKNLVSSFMDVNLETLNARETLKALDALINFNENNQATGGMQSFVDQQKATEKANEIAKQNIPSRDLNIIGKFWSEQISTLPQLFENIFITQQKARKMSDAMEVTKYQNDTAKAERDARNFTDKYVNKFKKTKPNRKKWNDASNIYERGVYAFMNRTVDGNVDNQQTEFNRRKGLIEKSIEALREDGQEKKANLYKEAFDKVVGEAKNRTELSVDPINKQSVDFVANEWANVYPEVSDVALNVYNRKLDADLNYTPDNFSRLKETDSKIDLNEPLFKESNFAYDKESGTLLPTTKPKSLTDRYVNLDFDSQNINSLQNALTDVYSAGTVQYMNAFINSDSFKQIVPDARAREVLRGRIKTLVDLKRNQAYVTKSQKEILDYVNKIATISTGRVLGGIAQFPKQFFPPLINTFGQAGGVNTIKGFTSLFNKDANAFLDKSGMSIANRGIQSQTALESVNKKLDANLDSTGQKILSSLAKPSEFLLKTFLVTGDKAAARASWIAYYLQGLKKQGINSTNIDWATHEMNQDAANFAQQQVDRNQNVSDADLQGEIFTSKKPGTVVGRKIFFPFATFILNAKNRMVNDGRALFSKTSSTQEKGQALRSLLALSAEQASFHTMGYFITNTMYKLAENMIDEIEPDEDKRKREKNMLKGRLTTVVTDIASPIPPLDYPTIVTINKMLEAVQSDEDPFQFFSKDSKTFLEQFGQLGIGADKATRLDEMRNIVMNGTYTDSYGREKEISEYGKSKVEAQLLPYFLYSLGLLPTEMGSLSEKVVKMSKKLKDADVEYYPIQ